MKNMKQQECDEEEKSEHQTIMNSSFHHQRLRTMNFIRHSAVAFPHRPKQKEYKSCSTMLNGEDILREMTYLYV